MKKKLPPLNPEMDLRTDFAKKLVERMADEKFRETELYKLIAVFADLGENKLSSFNELPTSEVEQF